MKLPKQKILDFTAVGHSYNNGVGVSYTPDKKLNTIAGLDATGRTFFTNPQFGNNSKADAGTDFVQNFSKMYDGFGIIDDKQHGTLANVAAHSSDPSFLENLDSKYTAGPKDFVNTITDKFNPTGDAKTNSALASYMGYNKWSNLSPAQKSLSVAQSGIQSIPEFSGTNLINTVVPGSQSPVDGKGLTVGAAMESFDYGVNGYDFAKKFGQFDVIGKLAANAKSPAETAQVAKSLGVIGYGVNGGTVPGITSESLMQMGASAAPEFGVGAIKLQSGSPIPSGYQLLPSIAGQEAIAMPQANAHSSSINGNTLQATVDNVHAIGGGVDPISKYWDTFSKSKSLAVQGTVDRGIQGFEAGSMAAAKSAAQGNSNPYLLAAIVAFHTFSGISSTSKSTDQQSRDYVRRFFSATGLTGKDNTIKLADGTIADLGIDGHGGKHDFKYGDKIASADSSRQGTGTLNAYDTDYTNDLDYFSGTAGITLSRLLTGQNSSEVKQVGSQIGNAALGKVGYGQDMTPDNFNSVMNNMKSIYANRGITSKEGAFALTNKLYGDHKINDSELVQMQTSINMVFDNDFKSANNLAAGRFKGIELAMQANNKDAPPVVTAPVTSKEDIIAKNKQVFRSSSTEPQQVGA